MNSREVIQSRYDLILRLERSVEDKIQHLPVGNLKIKHCGNCVYYYLKNNGSDVDERLLKREEHNLINGLAQKSYLKKVLSVSKQERLFLEQVIENYPEKTAESIYDQLSAERKLLVRPIILPDDQFVREWLEKPYTPKPFHKNDPIFETMKGHRVRSKAEMIIADRLYTSGIPYKYECPLVLGKEIRHPDFTILKVSERKVLYLEHCGKVGDEGYGDDMVDRINLYSENGILLGDRLFLTLESSNRPFDVRTLDNLINEIFR